MHRRYIQLNSGRKFRVLFPEAEPEGSTGGGGGLFGPPLSRAERTLALCDSVYALRPLLHLLSLRWCGSKSWLQWLTPAVLDLASVWGSGPPESLFPEQRAELRRRTLLLLFYLLRSPFYEHVTR